MLSDAHPPANPEQWLAALATDQYMRTIVSVQGLTKVDVEGYNVESNRHNDGPRNWRFDYVT